MPDGREEQTAIEQKEMELPPTTLDAADPRAEDVPIPKDNEVSTLKAKKGRDGAEPEDF